MGWINTLLGSSDFVNKVTDAAINTGDKLVYTDEEKTEAHKKVLDWYLEYLKVTNPQNIARRLIALSVTLLWCIFLIIAVTMEILGFHSDSKFIFETIKDNINQPFSIVLAFYFATHALRALKK